MRYTIIVLLSIFSLSQAIQGQTQDYVFRTFSPEGGLSYDGVIAIEQDQRGYIWTMTDYELFRFDGYRYKRYQTEFPEWEKAANWTFSSMTVDQDGDFFIATRDGLYRYNEITDTFVKFLDQKVSYLEKDKKGFIWIKTNNALGILDKLNATVSYPKHEGKELSSARQVLSTHLGELYVLTDYGKIYRFDYNKEEFFAHHSEKLEIEGLGYIRASQIYDSHLWMIIGNNELYKMNLSNLKVEKIHKGLSALSTLFRPIRTMHIDKNGMVWLGTMNGLYVYNPQSEELKHYEHHKDNMFSIPNNSIWVINEDNLGNLWIGTYAGGHCYVNVNKESPFITYLPTTDQLNHAPVSSFAENDEFLWIGTEGGGVNRMNKNNNNFSYYTNSSTKNSLSHNNVKTMLLDHQDNLWIGTYSEGLNQLNTKTGAFKNYKQDPQNRENTLLSNSIRKLVEEPSLGLWIVSQIQSLTVSFFSYKDDSITHYPLVDSNKGFYILDALRDRDHNLWLLTHQKLFKLNIHSKKAEEVGVGDSLALSGQSLTMDMSGNIWIGTAGKGLIEYNINNRTHTIHKDILSNNVSSIYSMTYDSKGVLWLGTDNGLFSYNIISESYSRYGEFDGTQGAMYYPPIGI